MLVEEVIANVIENGVNIGPKRCVAGDIVEVFDGVGDMLIAYNRAELVKDKKAVTKELETEEVEPEVEEKPKTSKTQKPKQNDDIWHTDSEPLSKKRNKGKLGKS